MTNPTGYTALDLVGYTDKGDYSSIETYVKNDLTNYNGIKWRCLIDDTTDVTPTEGLNWTKFIKYGDYVNEVDYEEDIYGVETPNPQSIQNQLTNQTNVLGAKNWLENNATSQVIDGITWTVNADKTVTANGSLESGKTNSQFSIPFTFGGRSFLFNGSPNNGNCAIYIWDATTNARAKKSNGDECDNSTYNSDSEVVPVEGHDNRLVLRVVGTVSNVTFKPMLRLASDPNNTYVPFAMTNRALTVGKLNMGKVLTSSDNLNNVMETGLYIIRSSVPTNSPESVRWCSLLVNKVADNSVQQQIFEGQYLYQRAYGGSTPAWKSWYKFTGTIVS